MNQEKEKEKERQEIMDSINNVLKSGDPTKATRLYSTDPDFNHKVSVLAEKIIESISVGTSNTLILYALRLATKVFERRLRDQVEELRPDLVAVYDNIERQAEVEMDVLLDDIAEMRKQKKK